MRKQNAHPVRTVLLVICEKNIVQSSENPAGTHVYEQKK